MNNMMSYEGYLGSVQYSDEDSCFYGKVEFIRSLISYEGTDVKDLKESFKKSIDSYLALCSKMGNQPEKPFKGSFNVRTGSNLHRNIALYAKNHQMNLNQVVMEALEQYLKNNKKK